MAKTTKSAAEALQAYHEIAQQILHPRRATDETGAPGTKRLEKRRALGRRKPTDKDRATINRLIEAHYPVDLGVVDQMMRDLRTYMLYDCLSMWLDPHAGLAKYEPELMLALGQHFVRKGA